MTNRYFVTVYLAELCYGGPEEGGWWFEGGEHVRTVRMFTTEERAWSYCGRLNHRLERTLNAGRRPLHSVLSNGRYTAQVHANVPPVSYPETQPHYA